MTQQINFKSFFDDYMRTVFQTEIDLRFWKHFLSISIDKYKLDNPANRWINQSGFSLYNIQPDGSDTWLHVSKETFTIEIKDLDIHSDNFFTWIMNLAIIRIYNSVELLLLQSIQSKYFPNLQSPISKRETNKLIAEIRNFLTVHGQAADLTNNRYIIEFLKNKSSDFENFLKLPINPEWKTKWSQFYEFFSILRIIITHNAMIVSKDVRNNLNSIAKDVFHHQFTQPINKSDEEILKPKDEHHFLHFISQVNDFAANSVKFIAEKTDFVFIGLHKA